MWISDKGIELIKRYEGCKLSAYKDSVGIPTIGYGHIKGVKIGQTITQAQADALLKSDLLPVEKYINGIGAELTQNEFDALCSFCFNLGTGALAKSTLLKRIKAKHTTIEKQKEFLKWICAGGKRFKGLFNRREQEAILFGGASNEFTQYANAKRKEYGF